MYKSLVLRGLLFFHLFGAFVRVQASFFDTGSLKFTVSGDSVPYAAVTKSCANAQSTQLIINTNTDFDMVRLQVATDNNLHVAKVWVQAEIRENLETGTRDYLWLSGDPIDRSKFATHFAEPDGAGTGCTQTSELCVGMSMYFKTVNMGAYHLYDLCCTENLRYMCNYVPEAETNIDPTSPISIEPNLITLEVKKESAVLQCSVAGITDDPVTAYFWYLNGNLHHNEADDSVWNNITIFGNDTYSSWLFTCAVELLQNNENVMTKQSKPVGGTFYASAVISTDASIVECNQTVVFDCNTREQNFSLIEGFAWRRSGQNSKFQDDTFTTTKNIVKIERFQSHDISYYSCAVLYWDKTTSVFSDEIMVTIGFPQTNITAKANVHLDDNGQFVNRCEITCLPGSCGQIDGFIFERVIGNASTPYESVNGTFYILYTARTQSGHGMFTIRCATVLKYVISDWSDEISFRGEFLRIDNPSEQELSTFSDRSDEISLPGEFLRIANSSKQELSTSSSQQPGIILTALASLNEQLSTTAIMGATSPSVGLPSSSPFLDATLESASMSLSQQSTPEFMVDLYPTQNSILSPETQTSYYSSDNLPTDSEFMVDLSPTQNSILSPETQTSYYSSDSWPMDSAWQTSPLQQTLLVTIELSPLYTSTMPVTSQSSVSSFQASAETYKGTTEPNPFSSLTPPVVMATALFLVNNSNVSLICSTEKVDGWATREYTWFFNDVVISNQRRFMFYIGNFNDMNVGEYKCAVMTGGVSSLESNVIVLALANSDLTLPEYLSEKPTVTSDPAIPVYNSSVTLNCMWNNSFVSEYFFILNETIVHRSVKTNTYVIEMFKESDVGHYRCVVDLESEIARLMSESLFLNVLLPTSTFTIKPTVNTNKPYLTSSFTVGYVGDWLMLSCISPQADTGIENYVILKVQTSLKIVYRGSSQDTVIKGVSSSDAGDYACLYKSKDGTTSEKSDSVSVKVVPIDAVCYCPCPVHLMHLNNITDSEVKELTSVLKQNLSVSVNNLSATVRQFVSAQDERQSSAGIGTAAVGIVSTVFGLIMASDLIYVYQAAMKLLKRKMNYG